LTESNDDKPNSDYSRVHSIGGCRYDKQYGSGGGKRGIDG